MSKRAMMVAVALGVLAMTSGLAVGQPFVVGDMLAPCLQPVAETSAPAAEQTTLSPAIAMAMRANSDMGLIVRAPNARDITLKNSLTEGGAATQPQALSVEFQTAAPQLGDSLGASGLVSHGSRPVEFSIVAPVTMHLDVAFARRRVDTETPGAYVTGSGAEVRVGQNLAQRLQGESVQHKGWYLFAASDGRALTWTPVADASSPSRGVRLEDATEIGDVQAGVALSKGAMQTSLSVVKRTVKTYFGPYSKKADNSFAGLTFSWNR